MNKNQQSRAHGRSNKIMLLTGALAIVAAAIIGLNISNANANSRFEDEMNAINSAFSSGNDQKINEVLNRTVSSGDLAQVETSLKNYVGDLIANINQIKEVADDDSIYGALEAEHLAKNSNNLGETIASLNNASDKITTLSADAEKLYGESGANSYVADKNLSDEYRQLYTKSAKTFYADNDLSKDHNNTLDLLHSTIKVEIEALSFLNSHKSEWTVKNNKLVFKNDGVANEYAKILERVANY